MGQKVNPIGFRTGWFYPWKSRWFNDSSSFKEYLIEDIKIRKSLMKRLMIAGIDSVEIARLPKSMVITLNVSRPGVVIGRGGSGIEELKKHIIEIIREVRGASVNTREIKIDLQVKEVRNPELSAQLVATRIAGELERRMPHRRVVSRNIDRVMQSGAKGIKVVLSGRIGGADIGRTEKYNQGPVPTQTMRENIDYAQVPALLKRGYVGVKVWINKPKEN
ncbi:30S ribosomal protein S3 [Candidatus Woesebacteria bacterium RIFCSPHIGHO2_01_FULL_41_10]|uniref:Small ribosomal subunit protein uS3 n=1 Tax=Candidatus Woesebacteria bacterium RIFCSPHIGHO2_01_FULL_41_10 TaxID=1802500 RepID=A0A1F7YSG9_9BACT|nr:MAG: 30S ribosomal protein S3 [Candidatus Woesebacteria bacterium RIFCSPHIGHO2_01_FULL_41_10]